MRHVPSTGTSVLAALIGFSAVALVPLSGEPALSAEAAREKSHCACPDSEKRARPSFARLPGVELTEHDEIAALESIQMGLSQMDDGTPFVWRHDNGRLSGIVRPTVSFRNAEGQVCRHVVVLLTTGYKTSTAEGIACRLPNRRWVLEG